MKLWMKSNNNELCTQVTIQLMNEATEKYQWLKLNEATDAELVRSEQ